ncbi:MAG: sulfatase [Gemmatimonadota bacterium]
MWAGIIEQIPMFMAPYANVLVRVSYQHVWMTPLADVLFFGLVALVLLAVGRFWPVLRRRGVVVGVFLGLTALALGLVIERIYPLAVLALAIGIGIQAGRMARGPVRRRLWTPAVAVVGLLFVLGSTARTEWQLRSWKNTWLAWLPHAPAGAPNVLLLIMDTVRGASMSFVDNFGQAGDWPVVQTPVMDSLAARSTVFTRAIAPAPWTLPSHASMFTGQWPVQLWPGENQLGAEWSRGLDNRYPTVADVLSRAGYLTGGFVGNLTFTSHGTGLARGFLHYEDYPVSLGQTILSSSIGRHLAGSTRLRRWIGYQKVLNAKTSDDVADEFLRWQAKQTGHPFFAFLNFFDAHEPYFPPDSVRQAMPKGSHWNDYNHFAGLLTGAGALRADPWLMDDAERAAHAAGYAAGIRTIDGTIGRILRQLDRRGVLKNTIVIVTSDHGEQLGEHRLFDHNNSLYRVVLHVPLIIHDPRSSLVEGRVNQVVSLRNIGATILDMVGVNPSANGIGGRSLARFWAGRVDSANAAGVAGAAGAAQAARTALHLTGAMPDLAPDTAFTNVDRGSDNNAWFPISWGPSMYSLVDSTYHYVVNGDGSEELYNVRQDPAELHNLAYDAAMKPIVLRFRAGLRGFAPRLPRFQPGPVQHPSAPKPRGSARAGG